MAPVLEHSLIDTYIRAPFEGAIVEWLSGGEIKVYLETKQRQLLDVRKITRYLKEGLGIKPKKTKANWMYPVILKTEEEVKANRVMLAEEYVPE